MSEPTRCEFCGAATRDPSRVADALVGTRVAFEPETTRAWWICRSCRSWRPVDSDIAVDLVARCVKVFEESRVMARHGAVAMAPTSGGGEIIRLAQATTPHQFYAWRFGPQLIARARAHRILSAAASMSIPVAATLAALQFSFIPLPAVLLSFLGVPLALMVVPAARVSLSVGLPLRVLLWQVRRARLAARSTDAGSLTLELELFHSRGRTRLVGNEAKRGVLALLTAVHARGWEARDIEIACNDIAAEGGPEGFLRSFLTQLAASGSATLGDLSGGQRLALDLALRDEEEGIRFVTSAALLTRRWRRSSAAAQALDELLG